MNARAAQVFEVGAEPSQVLVGSVEVGGSPPGNVWWMCCVEKEEVTNKPQPRHVKFETEVRNKYCCLTEDDDDDAPTELCSHCKKKGLPQCMKCLLGKGSKKVINLGGNKHGFAS